MACEDDADSAQHIYRAPIERSAITLTIVYPETKTRAVPIEVRRLGFREAEPNVTPPKTTI